MFERFTERARQIIPLAQEEARALKHDYIGTEHILLGLLREEEGIAGAVLKALDVTPERVRDQVTRIIGPRKPGHLEDVHLPITPRGKKVLELALREALSLGQNYIGTEHILLGLLRESEGVAGRILQDLAGLEKVRTAVIMVLSGHRSTPPNEPPAESPLPYRTLERVPSRLMDVAVDLAKIIRDHNTDAACFERGYHRVEVTRNDNDVSVAFLTREPQAT